MTNLKIKRTAALIAAIAVVAGALSTPEINISADEMLGETSFDYKMLPWHTVESSPAKQNFELTSDGELHIMILNAQGTDNERWDLQTRYRNLCFKAGHKYKISFSAKAKRSGMELFSKIGNIKGDEEYFVLNKDKMQHGISMGGEWGNAAELTDKWQTFSGEFVPDRDLEGCEWSFCYAAGYLYGGNAIDGDEIWFDDMSVYCESCSEGYTEGGCYGYTSRGYSGLENNFISVNQLGYYNNFRKVAVLGDNNGDILYTAERISLDKTSYEFEVVNADTDETVYRGVSGNAINDKDSGDKVFKLDFSDFTDSGTYYIRVGEWRSFDFRIGNDIYSEKDHNLLTDSMNYFYQNRSGIEIEQEYITSGDKNYLAHKGGHYDDTAYVQKVWKGEYSSTDKASSEYASSSITANGGWYESGNHGKYVVNSGISLWTLQNMYERSAVNGNAAKFDDNSGVIVIPETDNGVPDILDEAAYELDWMADMVVKPDEAEWGKYAGMVYHSVQDHKWTGLATRPYDYMEEWGAVRVVKPPTFAATLNYAACAAQAARLWKQFDSEKASKYLSEAKKAYDAYEKNYYEADLSETRHPALNCLCVEEELNEKSLYAPSYHIDGGTNYSDFDVSDEAYWAACEIFVSASTMDDADAEKYFKKLSDYKKSTSDKAFRVNSEISGINEKGNSQTSFNWCRTSAAGTLTLALHKELLPEAAISELESSLTKAADDYVNKENYQGYGIPYSYEVNYYDPSSSFPEIIVDGYEYGSNSMVMNNAVVMAYAYDQTKDNKYLNGVSAAMDYILGTNPLSLSYITGYGSYHTVSPYHRYWSKEIDKTFPSAPDGVLSGGPNAWLQDPYVRALGFVPGKYNPSQRCYIDSLESWSTNDSAANFNAPLAWVASFLQDQNDSSVPDETSEIKGDVNCDGKVDITDITVLALSLVDNVYLKDQAKVNADVDGDGKIHLADLARIKQYVSKQISSLG